MNNRKQIALVTTWFPPKQSVATNRMLAFAEYLSEDFEIIVFALDDSNHSKEWAPHIQVNYIQSKSLFDLIRSNTKDSKFKHTVKTALRVMLSKFVSNPLKNWQKGVTDALQQSHTFHPFDLIISSYAPQEAHLAALNFIRNNRDVKWIADMRDEMSKNPGIKSSQKIAYQKIEADINQFASAILSVSKPILDDFRLLCPNVAHFAEVRNGYNHSVVPMKHVGNSLFTIGYFGSFYGGRNPSTFFQALEYLIEKRPDFDFRFVVVGAHKNFDIPSRLLQKITFVESLPYKQAIEKMMEMDLNVVIHPRSNQKGVFTGKLFDYLSVKRPVLACVDKDDVAAQLILEMNAGYVAECNDLQENISQIERAFEDWKKGDWKTISEENRISLHRKSQVHILKELIKTVLE
jgi:glycosyltransferase involved in cell wall biosynthesis